MADAMEYIKKIEEFYAKDNDTAGPMNNNVRFYPPKTQLFPISLFSITPFELFFWESSGRSAIKVPPAVGMILSLIVGPFATIILYHTELKPNNFKPDGSTDFDQLLYIYHTLTYTTLGIHCLLCPIADILLFLQFPKKSQPLCPFVFWICVYSISVSLLAADMYFIYHIRSLLTDPTPNSCNTIEREDCRGADLYRHQMRWFLPIYSVMALAKAFFIWMVVWYAINSRDEPVEVERTKYVEPEDWYFYKPNEIYGMGFSYWDNYDTPNPQGEIGEYYSDLISKGLAIQPPEMDDLGEKFNYATSSGYCPL